MIKNGAQHLKSLDDGRAIYLNGERLQDPLNHPAFRNAIGTVCRLYDIQTENPDVMTVELPGGRGRIGRQWHIPASHSELVLRREAMTQWARSTCGFFGRSPDHVPSALCGMLVGLDRFCKDKARADAFRKYVEYASENDLFVTYTIVNPQGNQSKGPGDQGQAVPPACRVVEEGADGIVVDGAKMLGTSAVMANEVFVANIQPLKPGEEAFALSFSLPLGTPGVRILSRKSYEQHASSEFDNPLAHRFDENDALICFDRVKVPWERVFIHKDIAMAGAQFRDTWAAPMQNHHSQIRLMVKLQFLLGLAKRVAETNGVIDFPQVREQLGRMAAQASMVECFVHAMEATGESVNGYYVPNRHLMHAATCVTQELYPQFITLIRELAGGGLIMLPSSEQDFSNPEIRGYIGRTQRSPVADSYGRVKLMRLAWDAVGSEFASRHVQYEMFYAGAQVFQRAAMYRTYDWDRSTGLVDSILSGYDLPLEVRP